MYIYKRRDPHGFNPQGLYIGEGSYKVKRPFNPRGFTQQGQNIYTGTELDPWGFDMDGVYKATGKRRDLRGFDANGQHKVGYYGPEGTWWDPDKRWDEKGIDRNWFTVDSDINLVTGTKFDSFGYDKDGFNAHGFDREGFDRSGYDSTGRNRDGYDREGFDAKGFNRYGYDRHGFNADGLDRKGHTHEWCAKYNQYGVDSEGHLDTGEMDPDIAVAKEFLEGGYASLSAFAADNQMDEEYARRRIDAARRKLPSLDQAVGKVLKDGNRQRLAAMANDCARYLSGKLSLDEFWDKHPRITIVKLMTMCMRDNPLLQRRFTDKMLQEIIVGPQHIETILSIFGGSRYDVAPALSGIEEFRMAYNRLPVDGSPEQAKRKRANVQKLYDLKRFIKKYEDRNFTALLKTKLSYDGGKTWITYTQEMIDAAMQTLRKNHRIVCVRTVKEVIEGHYVSTADSLAG